MKAYLVLENGTIFEGESFGAQEEVVGEVAFTTGMGGYLETLTDPSFYGQIVLQTFPLIGNYGIIPDDFESAGIAAKAYIAKYPCKTPSNFRSEGDLDTFLKKHNIVGLCGIDTRALTKMIREAGVMNGKITLKPPVNTDITEAKAYKVQSAVPSVSGKYTITPQQATAAAKHKVALIDFGTKSSIPKELIKRGCDIHFFKHNATAEEIMSSRPDGVMLSNGPGDPSESANLHIIETVRSLQRTGIPMFGICIGHQFLALANGYKTRKMKFGHRGANQPVKDIKTGRIYITSQNHGYTVVSGGSSFVNVNDGSCEGLEYSANTFSVQFHPEARSGPEDTAFLFDRFIENIERCK